MKDNFYISNRKENTLIIFDENATQLSWLNEISFDKLPTSTLLNKDLGHSLELGSGTQISRCVHYNVILVRIECPGKQFNCNKVRDWLPIMFVNLKDGWIH